MYGKTPRIVASAVAGALWVVVSTCWAASLPASSGSIAGLVSSQAGVPQMGAAVFLYDRFDRLVARALTTEQGSFHFPALLPDLYSVRVSLASFLPAIKRNIAVQPGMQSLLNVNLASVFSSIDLIYTGPGQVMSDDWKWVLRGASATRPVLRFGAGVDLGDPAGRRTTASSSAFSDVRGMVRLSAGEQPGTSSLGGEPDLGTAFALAASLFGANQFQVSGNLGYASNSGIPSAGFRTSFRREMADGTSPEFKLTMRQMFLPSRIGGALAGGQLDGVPVLRTLAAAILDRTQLTDDLRIEYGMSLDSVTFLERLNYFSPYARLTYRTGTSGTLQVAYASGAPPAELFASGGETEVELQQDLSALALFPRVSVRSGTPRVQRVGGYELGYRKTIGSRTYGLAAYREGVRNAAVTLMGPGGIESTPELLPDLFSNSWVLNAGEYRRTGYLASVTQNLGDHFDTTLAFGSGGTLTVDREALDGGSPDQLRKMIRSGRRDSITARISGTAPRSGTQFITSYQWSNLRSLTAAHMYMTQRMREGLGWNFRVRQPLPYLGVLPGRLEATAELRNLLAQGYVPLSSGGRVYYLVHTPRSLRGGLSFIF